MACEQFAAAGMPVDEARFRIAVTRMARLPRIGETRQPAGSKGGRGNPLYEIWQLQQLHKDVAKWIPASGGEG
jgi:cytochrome c556